VRSDMAVEGGLHRCLERAMRALEGLLPTVRSDMAVEGGLHRCLERAVWALEGLLPRVRSEMLCEIALLSSLVSTFGAAVHDGG
jgi:hypothetical protein